MIRRSRLLRGIAASAAISCLGLVLLVGTASATETAATWTNPGEATLKGSLTLKLNGSNAKTCSLTSAPGTALNGGGESFFEAQNYLIEGMVEMKCGTGVEPLVYYTPIFPKWNGTSYTVWTEAWLGASAMSSPYGGWWQERMTRPFVNGSGTTPSKETFSETRIGTLASGGAITATGSLEYTTRAGAALTLTH